MAVLVPRFEKSGHKYYLGDRPLVSVSKVLEDQGLKVNWYQNQNNQDLRGEAVHLACHDIIRDRFDWANYPATETRPYIEAYLRFRDQWGLQVEERSSPLVELMIWHPELLCAGTLDQVVKTKDGRLWLLDLKSGTMPPAVGVQLGAYDLLAGRSRGLKFEERKCVLLQSSGKADMSDFSGPKWPNIALGAINVYNFRRENNLLDRRTQ